MRNHILYKTYGAYTTKTHPYGFFDEHEMQQFANAAEQACADIAFCGSIRMFDNGFISKSYFTDVTQLVFGKNALEMIKELKWVTPRLFGTLIKTEFMEKIPRLDNEAEDDYVLRLVEYADKILLYGNYATAIHADYDISSIRYANPKWHSPKDARHIFPPLSPVITESGKNCRIFIIGVPEHGNLGDQAIIYTMKKFTQQACPNATIYEISEYNFIDKIDYWCHVIKLEDTILLPGGGNLGDLYKNTATYKSRELVIKQFQNNKIVVFPQSCHYENNVPPSYEIDLFSKCQALTLCAREQASYDIMQKHFHNKVILCPDIVLSFRPNISPKKRSGVLLVIRMDKESVIGFDDLCSLKAVLSKRFSQITSTDTAIKHASNDRQNEILKKWEQFSQATVVITDRLHGAIFAAITKTPCVVMPNSYHKIESSCKWLSNLKYIAFCKNTSELWDNIEKVCATKQRIFDLVQFRKLFIELEKILKANYQKSSLK